MPAPPADNDYSGKAIAQQNDERIQARRAEVYAAAAARAEQPMNVTQQQLDRCYDLCFPARGKRFYYKWHNRGKRWKRLNNDAALEYALRCVKKLGGSQSEEEPEEPSGEEEDSDGDEEAEADAGREWPEEASGGLGGQASPLRPASPQQTEQPPSSQGQRQQQGQSQQQQQQRQASQPCEAGPSCSRRAGPAAATSTSGQAPVHGSAKDRLLAVAKVVMREAGNGNGGEVEVDGRQGQAPVLLDPAHLDVAAVFQSNLSWFCGTFAGKLKRVGRMQTKFERAAAQSRGAQAAVAEAQRKQGEEATARGAAQQRVTDAIAAAEEARTAHIDAKGRSLDYYRQLPRGRGLVGVRSAEAVRLGAEEEAAKQLMLAAADACDAATVALAAAEGRLQRANEVLAAAQAEAAACGTALAAACVAYNECLQLEGPEQVPGQPGQPGTAPMEV